MAAPSDSQSKYNQEEKKECRSKLIEHAVRCLTKERKTSACVQRDHVRRVWKRLQETGEAQRYFDEQQRQGIEREIKRWEHFHDSQIQTRKPSDLRVCYLAGDNPINDLEVLTEKGILTQNVWAIEKNSQTLEKAWESIKRSTNLRNVRLFKGDILNFLNDFEGQFDIIYYDACGSLPSVKQKTLKFIGYVFRYNKLTSPGALITSFSFPPKQTAEVENASSRRDDYERKEIRDFVEEYLKYRLANTFLGDNSPDNNDERLPEMTSAQKIHSGYFNYQVIDSNAERLREETTEDIYGDYITYQVIDSAYLFIPALRMLSSTRSGKSCPLWEQVFVSKDDFLKEVTTYDRSATSPADSESSTSSKSEAASKSPAASKSTKEGLEKEWHKLLASYRYVDSLHKGAVRASYLRMMGYAMTQKNRNRLCSAWVDEIFPDREFKKQKISSLLLTHLLSYSLTFIAKFCNEDCQRKCQDSVFTAWKQGKLPRFCGVPDDEISSYMVQLVSGLLYGQMAYPSFPVVDKLLRLRYTANQRQMFSDVFIFDKCRYVYEQFPSVDCSVFAIKDLQQQMVFRMVVDGLRKHLRRICNEDLFQCCTVASIDVVTDGGVDFCKGSWPKIPDRQEIRGKV